MEDTTANEVNLRLDPVIRPEGSGYSPVAMLVREDGGAHDDRLRGFIWKEGERWRGMLQGRPGTYHASGADAIDKLRGIMERDLSKPCIHDLAPALPGALPADGPRIRRGHVYAEQIGYDVYHEGVKGRIGSIQRNGNLYVGKLGSIEEEFHSPSIKDVLASMSESDARGSFFETGYQRALQSYSATAEGQLEGWEAGVKVVADTREGDDD